jgi:hypothetical protein
MEIEFISQQQPRIARDVARCCWRTLTIRNLPEFIDDADAKSKVEKLIQVALKRNGILSRLAKQSIDFV